MKHRPRTTTLPRGFTLVEVLVMLVLIGIVIPVAMRGVVIATSAGSVARHSSEAASLADSKLNELIAGGQWTIASQSGDFGFDWPQYKWTAQAVQRDTDLMEMKLDVTWTVGSGPRSISVSTLIYTGGTATATTAQ